MPTLTLEVWLWGWAFSTRREQRGWKRAPRIRSRILLLNYYLTYWSLPRKTIGLYYHPR